MPVHNLPPSRHRFSSSLFSTKPESKNIASAQASMPEPKSGISVSSEHHHLREHLSTRGCALHTLFSLKPEEVQKDRPWMRCWCNNTSQVARHSNAVPQAKGSHNHVPSWYIFLMHVCHEQDDLKRWYTDKAAHVFHRSPKSELQKGGKRSQAGPRASLSSDDLQSDATLRGWMNIRDLWTQAPEWNSEWLSIVEELGISKLLRTKQAPKAPKAAVKKPQPEKQLKRKHEVIIVIDDDEEDEAKQPARKIMKVPGHGIPRLPTPQPRSPLFLPLDDRMLLKRINDTRKARLPARDEEDDRASTSDFGEGMSDDEEWDEYQLEEERKKMHWLMKGMADRGWRVPHCTYEEERERRRRSLFEEEESEEEL